MHLNLLSILFCLFYRTSYGPLRSDRCLVLFAIFLDCFVFFLLGCFLSVSRINGFHPLPLARWSFIQSGVYFSVVHSFSSLISPLPYLYVALLNKGMSSSAFQRLDVDDQEKGLKYLPSLAAPQVDRSTWLFFLHMFAACLLIAAVSLIVVSSMLLDTASDPNLGPVVVASLSAATSIIAGICAHVSVELSTRKNIKRWIITHWTLFGINAIFLLAFSLIRSCLLGIVINMSVFQFLGLIFLATYTPLASVPDLRRPPTCCGLVDDN